MTSIEWLQNEIYLRGPVGDGPDDIPKWLKDLYEKAKEIHKAEQEISDEKIEKEAFKETATTDSFIGFLKGAKWYREQLKQNK